MSKTIIALVALILISYASSAQAETLKQLVEYGNPRPEFVLGPDVGYEDGSIGLVFGSKSLSHRDWAPVDNQGEIGLKFDLAVPRSGVYLACDILSSSASQSAYSLELNNTTYSRFDYTGSTVEKNLGIRFKSRGDPNFSAVFGVGLSFISAKWGGRLPSTGHGTGLWLELGLNYQVQSFIIGLDFISSSATADMAGYNAQIGGGHIGLLMGYRW